jgi:hypothetical protein
MQAHGISNAVRPEQAVTTDNTDIDLGTLPLVTAKKSTVRSTAQAEVPGVHHPPGVFHLEKRTITDDVVENATRPDLRWDDEARGLCVHVYGGGGPGGPGASDTLALSQICEMPESTEVLATNRKKLRRGSVMVMPSELGLLPRHTIDHIEQRP